MRITNVKKTIAVSGIVGLSLLPIAAGSAVASDRGSYESSRASSSNPVLSPSQLAAIAAARSAYRAAAAKAADSLDSALATIQADLSRAIAPQLESLLAARDAYWLAAQYGGDTTATRTALGTAFTNFRAALAAAQGVAWSQSRTARASTATALESARAAYITAVTAQFPVGSVVPQRLLMPPRVDVFDEDEIQEVKGFSKELMHGMGMDSGGHGWWTNRGNEEDG